MFEESPNGYFINDLIIFNSLSAGGYVSKGFVFEPPDMINAQVSELNGFQDQLSLLMQSLTENQRLQIRRLRVGRGWSQAKLAMQLQLRGLDIGRECVAQIEAQTHCVKDRDLHHFARALEVDLSKLFPMEQTPFSMTRV